MTGPAKKSDEDLLDCLLDAELEALLAADDEVILTEAAEYHQDRSGAADKLRSIVAAAVTVAGKRRLAAARSALDAESGIRGKVLSWPLQSKRDAVARLRKEVNGLTMAARQGQDESEAELDCIIEDLIDLGVIDDEGNKA
jgi:hypothetical protein